MTSSESCAPRCSRRSSSPTDGGSTNTLTTSRAHLVAELLRALPVDVEQHVAPGASAASTGSRGVP